MQREFADTVAIRALGWLAANDDLLPVFLGSTGADPAGLGESAGDPAFLGAVLDFLMMDDQWVVAFCDGAQLQYDRIMQARQALPGGAQVNWT